MIKERAWNNVHEWNSPSFQNLDDILSDFLREEYPNSDMKPEHNPIYILSTDNKIYGAVYMFDKETLKHVSDIMGGVLSEATNIAKEIYDTACTLFDELWDGTPTRHLGVHTGRISNRGTAR